MTDSLDTRSVTTCSSTADVLSFVRQVASRGSRDIATDGPGRNVVTHVCDNMSRALRDLPPGSHIVMAQLRTVTVEYLDSRAELSFVAYEPSFPSLDEAARYPLRLGSYEDVNSGFMLDAEVELNILAAIAVEVSESGSSQLTHSVGLIEQLDEITTAFSGVKNIEGALDILDTACRAARDGWDDGAGVVVVAYRIANDNANRYETRPLFARDESEMDVLWLQRYQGEWRRLQLRIHGHDSPLIGARGSI